MEQNSKNRNTKDFCIKAYMKKKGYHPNEHLIGKRMTTCLWISILLKARGKLL